MSRLNTKKIGLYRNNTVRRSNHNNRRLNFRGRGNSNLRGGGYRNRRNVNATNVTNQPSRGRGGTYRHRNINRLQHRNYHSVNSLTTNNRILQNQQAIAHDRPNNTQINAIQRHDPFKSNRQAPPLEKRSK